MTIGVVNAGTLLERFDKSLQVMGDFIKLSH